MRYVLATIVGLMLLSGLAVCVVGCGPSWPVQWKASEAIKQSQGLVEDNLQEARPHADNVGKVHIDEAAGASRIVTGFVGSPTTRRAPIKVHTKAEVDAALAQAAKGQMASPANQAAIDQARRDLAREAPTPRDVALAIPQEIEESVMPWAELGIIGLSIFAPGAAGVAMRYRKKYKQYADAFTQTVEGVDVAALEMDADARDALLQALAEAQDKAVKDRVDIAQKAVKATVDKKAAKKAQAA